MPTLKEEFDKLHTDVSSYENSCELVDASNKLRTLLDTLLDLGENLVGLSQEDYEAILLKAIK